jgi:hypothetical protein
LALNATANSRDLVAGGPSPRYTLVVSAEATIRGLLHRDPFEPFRVVTSSGESYRVGNPDLVALMRSQIFIARPNSDRRAYVPFLHVTAVETISNGPVRRRKRRR